MNTLGELRDKFLALGLELHYEGWLIRVGNDKWTLFDSRLYRNGLPFADKDLTEYLKGLKANPPKLHKHKPAKITANRSIEHDGQSNQTS